jgi:hypothetical protein
VLSQLLENRVGRRGFEERSPVADALEQRTDADESVVAAEQVRSRAAPRVVLGPRDEARPDGIELDVARRSEGVALVHDARREAPLPEAAGPTHALVDRERVPPVRLAERRAQRLRGWRDEDAVDVIGHQAPRPDLDAVTPALIA